jgi:hypothetical protein
MNLVPQLFWIVLLSCLQASSLYAQVLEATPTADIGIGAELELSTFKKYLQPGDPPVGGLNLMISVMKVHYSNAGQHSQVMRLCKFQESVATNEEDRISARNCRLGSLTSLGRYSEAEELSYELGEWTPRPKPDDIVKEINRVYFIAGMAELQGDLKATEVAHKRILELVNYGWSIPPPVGNIIVPEAMKTALASLTTMFYVEKKREALSKLATLAYYRQDEEGYVRLSGDQQCSSPYSIASQ